MGTLVKKISSKKVKVEKPASKSKIIRGASKSNRITTKGQVTIPQNIREIKGFLPNTDVEFIIENDRVYIEKTSGSKLSRGQQIVQHLKGRCKTRMTTEDLMKLTRGE